MEKRSISQPVYRYALVDASASPQVMQAVKNAIAHFGRRVREGFVISPHGESPIAFFEVWKKNGPIVEALKAQAERYSLYPAYVIQEDKDHLPKEDTGTRWYMVEEYRYDIVGISEEEFFLWRNAYAKALKEVYRDDSVFVKTFFYFGHDAVLHVMSFNSERSPKYRGKDLGVPEWYDAMEKLVAKMKLVSWTFAPVKIEHKVVRYTNL